MSNVNMEHLSLLTIRMALQLELQCPGMKATRISAMKVAKTTYGWHGNKASILRQTEDYIEDNFGPLLKRYTIREGSNDPEHETHRQ